jgi:hypothetical protein
MRSDVLRELSESVETDEDTQLTSSIEDSLFRLAIKL